MTAKYFLLYSSILIVVGFVLYITTLNLRREISKYLFTLVITLHIWLSVFFLISNYFTGRGVNDAVFFHLNYGLDGAGFSEYWAIIVGGVFGVTASLFAPYYILKFMSRFHLDRVSRVRVLLFYTVIFSSLVINPSSAGIAEHYQLSSLFKKDRNDLNKYFAIPMVKTKISKKKNIIWIYAESLE